MQFIDFGSGKDGSISSASGTVYTYAVASGAAGQKIVTTTLSVAIGDQILLWQAQGSGAGNYELVKVAGLGSGNFTAATNLVNSYTTGAQAVKSPQYTGGNMSGITGNSWDGATGGIIFLLVNGTVTQTGNVLVLGVNGTQGGQPGHGAGGQFGGFRGGDGSPPGGFGSATNGGAARAGEGFALSSYSTTVGATATSDGGGGGGSNSTSGNQAGAGAGGGYGTAGGNGLMPWDNGTAGGAYGIQDLTQLLMGAGGGGGAQSLSNTCSDGGGGAGGGVVLIICRNYVYQSGSLGVNGGAGGRGDVATSDNTQSGCGGGGGAGGSILIKCQSANIGTNILQANGGAGGLSTRGSFASGAGGSGGNGGGGRIAVYYLTTLTGTTNQTGTYYTKQDPSLVDQGGGTFLYNFI